jgi:hypothetical protein
MIFSNQLVYVDWNPACANMVAQPEASEHISIKERITLALKTFLSRKLNNNVYKTLLFVRV